MLLWIFINTPSFLQTLGVSGAREGSTGISLGLLIALAPPSCRHVEKGRFQNALDTEVLTGIMCELLSISFSREADQDSDGHVSFRDFEYAMNYGQAK